MFLKKGNLVDVISPASSVTKSELAAIKLFLEKNGLRARFHMDSDLLLEKKQSYNFSSFSAEKRFEQLKFALENKESQAVWCVRGGYGSADLIPLLQTTKKIPQNKIFIGFSDITSLAIFLQQKWNWQIIYGPMLGQLASGNVSAKSCKAILDLVFGKTTELKYSLNLLNKGFAANYTLSKNNLDKKTLPQKNVNSYSAKLVGGCLSVLAAHFGTSNQINWRDKILFLEDIDESGEKLERYFQQLIQVMVATKSFPQAIVLGNYLEGVLWGKSSAAEKIIAKKNIALAIKKFAQKIDDLKLRIPLFQEKTNCLGHSKNIAPLIIGAEARIFNSYLLQEF